MLADALHSIRSLLCTSTNATPHERFFNFHRRSSSGVSLPSWMQPGPVLLRRFVRMSKNDPLVDEVELTDVNPTYARVRYTDGRESSVSLRDLAPCPAPAPSEPQHLQSQRSTSPTVDRLPIAQNSTTPQVPDQLEVDNVEHEPPIEGTGLRRSTRVSRPPARYGW